VTLTFTQLSTVALGFAGALLSLSLALSTYKAAHARDWAGFGIALAFICAFMFAAARLISAFLF
jgi:hypothetical protein